MVKTRLDSHSCQNLRNGPNGHGLDHWEGTNSAYSNILTMPGSITTVTAYYVALPNPVLPGTYDDTNANIAYSGSWLRYPRTGNYNNTESYSATVGQSASLSFTGTGVKVIYYKQYNLGVINVSIDGGVPIAINQYAASPQFQQEWNSPILANGNHTLTLTHASGSYVILDAIEILGPPPETIDDPNASITYTGSGWNTYIGMLGGPIDGTGHYTRHPGDVASLTFTGRGVKIIYMGALNRAAVQIQIDGQPVTLLNQNAAGLTWQREWQSAALVNGEHTITITHAGTSVQYMDLDAIIVIK